VVIRERNFQANKNAQASVVVMTKHVAAVSVHANPSWLARYRLAAPSKPKNQSCQSFSDQSESSVWLRERTNNAEVPATNPRHAADSNQAKLAAAIQSLVDH